MSTEYIGFEDYFELPISQFPKINIFFGNCIDILKTFQDNSIHAIVTDPPYGLKEYNQEELEKKIRGKVEFGGFRHLLMGI
jgi:DNA modification methylase